MGFTKKLLVPTNGISVLHRICSALVERLLAAHPLDCSLWSSLHRLPGRS